MGNSWWNIKRQEVYASSDYHCIACGVHKSEAKLHQWLEAHEYYRYNYAKGIARIESIEPLCHFCHNFIHSGRLASIVGKEKSATEVRYILEHGFQILAQNKLQCFPFTLELAQSLEAETFGVTAYTPPKKIAPWSKWKLIFEGKEYTPHFQTYEEWANHYGEPLTLKEKNL